MFEFLLKMHQLYETEFDDDQFWMGKYVALKYNQQNIKLDYNTNLFYTAVQDWDNIQNHIGIINNKLKNKNTNNFPCIVHVPFRSKYGYCLDKLYHMIYQNISFDLENFKMNKNVT